MDGTQGRKDELRHGLSLKSEKRRREIAEARFLGDLCGIKIEDWLDDVKPVYSSLK